MADKTFMTMAEFSRHLGVSKPTVHAWNKGGYLVFGEGGKRLVDVERSIASLKSRPAAFRGGKAKGPHRTDAAPDQPDLSLAESTRRRQAAMAALAEFELERLRGEYPSKHEILETWSRLAVATRSMHLSLNSRLAFQLSILTPVDRASIEQVCRDDLEDAALGRGYFSLLKAEDARNFEAELARLRPHLLALPETLADALVGLSRIQVRDALRKAIFDLLDVLSTSTKKDGPASD